MPEVKGQASGEYVFVEPDFEDPDRSYTFYDDPDVVEHWRAEYADWARWLEGLSDDAPDKALMQRNYENGKPTDTRTRLICRSIR